MFIAAKTASPTAIISEKAHRATHHLHVVQYESDLWRNHLLFRDYLRAHPQIAAQYENLKRELAQTHRENREAYTEGKNEFIENVLKAAVKNSEIQLSEF